jgi:hypothetical protein
MKTNLPGVTSEMLHSIATYKKHGIDISLSNDDKGALIVRVAQVRIINGFILTNKQLYDRAKPIFEGYDGPVHIKPTVFKFDHSTITPEWITSRMEEFGINRNDLINQLQLDKERISQILNGKRGLTRLMRAAFYYYFLTFELNRDLRDE